MILKLQLVFLRRSLDNVTGSRGVQFELDNKESLTSLMAVIC